MNRHSEQRTVRFSEHDQINFLDEYLERLRTTKTERFKTEIFSIDIKSHSNMFGSDHILLDTCAGESVFNNKHLFYSIYNSDKPLSVSGVNAKGKPLVITQCGDNDFGIVYYDSNCIANLLSFGSMVNNSKSVSYIEKHICYTLQMRDRGCCYYFTRDKSSNIYICDLNTMVSKPKVMLVTTVRDKMLKYTQRHIKQAELAREYKRKLGYASTGQLIKLISQGKIANCNITAQDVVRAFDIWGPDLDCLKGKTPSHKAQIEDEQPILDPLQDKNKIMYIDLMFVNGNPFLIAVVKPLEYVMVNKLAKRDNMSLWTSLESDIRHITKYGYNMDMVRVDGEGAINTVWFETKLATIGTVLDTTGAGEAVNEVDKLKIR